MTDRVGEEVELRELTAAAPGGVSVLELSGRGTLARLGRLVGGPLEPGAPRLVRLAGESGELLDEALLWIPSAERAELHVHGSPPLVRRLAQELGITEERVTGPATLEERAQLALAGAPSEAAARVLLDQAGGALRSALEALRGLALVEARVRIEELQAAGRAALHVLRPPRVLLAGPANAGKSTLFNLLVGRERAVVDETLGTTRDALEELTALGPWAMRLFDTAGLRDLVAAPASGAREVELAGQALTRTLLERADLVLWLDPDPAAGAPALGRPVQRWTPRADELSEPERASAERPISVLMDPEAARSAVISGVCRALGLEGEAWSPHVPGAALPFDEASREGLRGLAESPTREAFVARLEALLGGPEDRGSGVDPGSAARVLFERVHLATVVEEDPPACNGFAISSRSTISR